MNIKAHREVMLKQSMLPINYKKAVVLDIHCMQYTLVTVCSTHWLQFVKQLQGRRSYIRAVQQPTQDTAYSSSIMPQV